MRNAYCSKFVVLDLGDCACIDFAFAHNQFLSRGPQVPPKQTHLVLVANHRKLLVSGAYFLCHGLALARLVCRQMHRLTIHLTHHVAKLAAGGFGQTTAP